MTTDRMHQRAEHLEPLEHVDQGERQRLEHANGARGKGTPHKVHMTERWASGLRPSATRVEWSDTVTLGLRLRVTAAGVKTWAVAYRLRGGAGRGDGTSQRMTLGRFPRLSLAAARTQAKGILATVAQGGDPAGELRAARKRTDAASPSVLTWELLVTRFLEDGAPARSRREYQRLLTGHVPAEWTSREAATIARAEVRALLKDKAKTAPVQANRLLAVVRRAFNFGIAHDLVESNPCAGIERPGEERQRTRWLKRDELRALWSALDAEETDVQAIFRLLLLTGQRVGEVRSMRWADVDLEASMWTVPSEHAKNKLEHRVPLSAPAVAILATRAHAQAEAHRDAGASPWVFPARSASGHRESVAKALKDIREATGLDFRIHDLRRTVATYLTGELSVSRFIVGRLLNHAEREVTAIYDRASYDREKREALGAWAGRLDEIVSPSGDAKDAKAEAANDDVRGIERDTINGHAASATSLDPVHVAR